MPFLSFKGKTAVETYHHTVPHHTLEFDPSLSVLPENAAPSVNGNLIIEGDNLLALKALLPTHGGKIKCIYIDPPYNTGNEKWVYNDNLTQPQFKEWIGDVVGKEGEDFVRHDKWCCMMYPRLQLLKELLREDGVIFVSIDDNEIANLRLLMDEIFGAENFVATVVWEKKYSPSNDAKWLSANHDFILLYAKSKAIWRPELLERSDAANARYENLDNDARGPWKPSGLDVKTYSESYDFEITTPSGRTVKPPAGASWRVGPARFKELLDDNRIWFGKTGSNVPAIKRFLSEVKQGMTALTIWKYGDVGHNQEATQELKAMGISDFDSPKPTRLLKRVLRLATEDGGAALVLDSFAGSGTTAQSVLELNKLDGGNRKFILIQQPFDTKDDEKEGKNICRTITAERVRRVIRGTDKLEAAGGEFTYAKLSAEPLFGQYRDLGSRLPDYEEIAKYVFYTETSVEWQRDGVNRETGRIGEHGGVSYYLLYRPNQNEDWGLDMEFLQIIGINDPNKRLVIYCEKVWLHKEDLRKWQTDNGKSVRQMLVPFNLK